MDTTPPPDRPAPARPSRLLATIKALTRTRLTAGLITVLPIYVTILLIRFVFEAMRDSSQWVVHAILQRDWTGWGVQWAGMQPEEMNTPGLQWGLAILSVFLTGFIIYAIGVLATNMLGRRALSLFEVFVDRVPLVKTVYHASKQFLELFAGSKTSEFKRVALVPIPSRKVRSLGFITAESEDELTGDVLYTVFIAPTPNPTSGFVFVVKKSDVIELDWSIEQAVKVLMSAGILTPPKLPFTQAAAPPIRTKPAAS